jgi:hypothetical protein
MAQSIRPQLYVDGKAQMVYPFLAPSCSLHMRCSAIPDWKWALTLQNMMVCSWSNMSFMKVVGKAAVVGVVVLDLDSHGVSISFEGLFGHDSFG